MITNPFALAAILLVFAIVMFFFWGIGDYYDQQAKARRKRLEESREWWRQRDEWRQREEDATRRQVP